MTTEQIIAIAGGGGGAVGLCFFLVRYFIEQSKAMGKRLSTTQDAHIEQLTGTVTNNTIALTKMTSVVENNNDVIEENTKALDRNTEILERVQVELGIKET